MEVLSALDWVLAPGVLILTAVLLNIRDRFAAVVLFIIYGLLIATIWVRLDAVDLALAEAAIGAGITGALLLNALAQLDPNAAPRDSPKRTLLAAIVVLPIVWMLGFAVASAPATLDGLGPQVHAQLPDSGTQHPVTAVLLSLRAYDTLLELAILLIAVIGVWALRLPLLQPKPDPPAQPLNATTRLVVPVAVVVAGYLLWRGGHGPGGAFQAAAVLAGAGVLLHLGLRSAWPRAGAGAVRLGLALALLAFTLLGLSSTLFGLPFLFYRGVGAQVAIVTIELAATIAIALALLAVFLGRAPPRAAEPP